MRTARRWAVWASVAVVLAAVTLARAFPVTFTGLSFWDDTGYMLAIIRGFHAHGGLYTRVFSQYGPWYSEFYALVCGVLGVPATQEGIRWITVAAWLAGSVAAGALAFRLTGRLALAALAQIVGFMTLDTLGVDAGHPVSLCVLCIAAAACTLPLPASGWGRAAAFGAALGALGLVKINLGVFAVAAVGTAWAFGTPRDRVGWLLRWAAGALLCALPLLLVRGAWSGSARACFLALILATLLGTVAVLSRTDATAMATTWRESARLGLALAAGWALVWLVGIGAIIATGTRPADVLGGMLLRPLGLSAIFVVELRVQSSFFLAAAVGLSGALGWRFLLPGVAARFGAVWNGRVESALRWLFLALMLGRVVAGKGSTPLLPFLWIGLLPPGDPAHDPAGPFARRALPLLAAAEFLSLYPVAGIQATTVSYLEALVAVLVVAMIPPAREAADPGPVTVGAPVRRATPLGLAALVLAGVFGWGTAVAWRARARTVPLALPGSALVHDNEMTVAGYECLSANLAGQRTFLTLPGVNSLYPWAGCEYPPVAANCTDNFALLTSVEQHALAEVGRQAAPVAMVYRQDLYQWWVQQHAPPSSALDDFRRLECRPFGHVQAFTLLHRADTPPPAMNWTHCARMERTADGATGQPTGRVTIQVSPAFHPASAILLDANGDALTLRLPTSPSSDGLTVTLPDPAILRTHPARELCLRLCDGTGRRLTTVPFFVPAE